MKPTKKIIFGLFSWALLSLEVWGLTPMESLILGDLSEYYSKEKVDPIHFAFQAIERSHSKVSETELSLYKSQLANYRGFYQEGQNLNNYCRRRPEISYSGLYERDLAVRTVMATLQYLMLDISVRALGQYGRELNFSENEFQNFSKNLIGNYCSQNLTLISLKQLERNLQERFRGENTFQLPSVVGNPLFPEKLASIVPDSVAKEKEMAQTIRLFQAACSWGGDADNKRLLVPLLRNPVVMSLVIRQLSSQKLEWREWENKIHLENDPQAVQVSCQNLICRKTNYELFLNQFPRSIGSVSLEDDLRRLYCHHFRDVDFQYKEQEPKLAELIRSWSFDQQNFMVGQFIALVTGIPDFFLHSESYQDLRTVARSGMDRVWDVWAQERTEVLGQDLFFEEPLTFEIVRRDLVFSIFRPEFKASIDVNLGEFDRINQRVGKLRTAFKVNVPHRFLQWAKRAWYSDTPMIDDVRKDIIKRFALTIQDDVHKARDTFNLPPWSGQLEELIAAELMEQIMSYRGESPFNTLGAVASFPVELNFGPFALKYMRYRFEIQQNIERQHKLEQNQQKIQSEALGMGDLPPVENMLNRFP